MLRNALILCLLSLLLAPGCSSEPDYDSALDRVLARGVLRVGTEPEFKPFESKNEKGEFVGFDIPDAFVVGYGLDYDGYYRNLPDIGVLKQDAL